MYGKLYESTYTGSMYGGGPTLFAVWGYVIANTKPDDLVELNPDMLGAVLGVKSEIVAEAIEKLCSPDPRSRTKKEEGRRLVKRGEYIYFVVNAAKYRGLPNDRERRAYFAEKQRQHRARAKLSPLDNAQERLTSQMSKTAHEASGGRQTGMSNSVKDCQTPSSTQYSVLSTHNQYTEAVLNKFRDWIDYRRGMGRKIKDWDAFFDAQLKWLAKFTEPEQLEILDQSMRNGWQGLFEPKRQGLGAASKPMSVFEIEKRCAAMTEEINRVFKRNGNKRVEGDGIDELKQRRDKLKRMMTE